MTPNGAFSASVIYHPVKSLAHCDHHSRCQGTGRVCCIVSGVKGVTKHVQWLQEEYRHVFSSCPPLADRHFNMQALC